MTDLKNKLYAFMEKLEQSARDRQKDYLSKTDQKLDVTFFHLELLGEIGELFMEFSLLQVEESTLQELKDEIGDYFICLVNLKNSIKDLTKLELDLLHNAFCFEFEEKIPNFESELCTALTSANYVKKLHRLYNGIAGNSATTSATTLVRTLEFNLADITAAVLHIAKVYNIDLIAAISEKFNKTSEKIGSTVKI